MSKPFNLKTAQIIPEAPMGDAQIPGQVPGQEQERKMPVFKNGNGVKEWLENEFGNPVDAIEFLVKKTNPNQTTQDPNNPEIKGSTQVAIKDIVSEFFSTNDDEDRLDAASVIFETIIPDENKAKPEGQVGQPDASTLVASVDAELKKLAEAHAKSAKKNVFNLQKQAQHKTLNNVVVLGPNNHIDQFTGQLINDWHLIERNKGFGLKVDGVLNMDFEKVWRENIMDKYYPGYIESRFEVDKMIPPTNNLQLEPGEKRRITPPEYSHTEARLEAARTAMNEERGYSPAEKGKPFNWKEASKKKVIAELKDLPDPFKSPGEEKVRETIKLCPFCHNTLKSGSTECPTCKVDVKPQDTGEIKMAPDPKGGSPLAGAQNMAIQKNTLMPPLQQRAQGFLARAGQEMPEDGIFFDGSNFICYAEQKKHTFSSFDDAEQFKVAKMDMKQMKEKQEASRPVDFKQMPANKKVNPATLHDIPFSQKNNVTDPKASMKTTVRPIPTEPSSVNLDATEEQAMGF